MGFTQSWVPRLFMVNWWCPYFRMYLIWIIYLQCHASTCVWSGPTWGVVFILLLTWLVVPVIVGVTGAELL